MILKDKTLWLIGASSGIGAALAPLLAKEGAILALSSPFEDDLNRVAESCTGAARPLVKPLDVTISAQVESVYAELIAAWGKVDIVVYNPATKWESRVETFDTDEVLQQIAVYYLGLVRVVGLAMPDMIRRRSGQIVGTASLAGYAGVPGSAAYSSSKSAVIAFLQSLRVELRSYGIGVVTVSPGFVRTALTEKNSFPMPFLLSADDAAARILKGLLAGDAEIHFPRRLSWPIKLITAMPRPIYEQFSHVFLRPRD